MHQYPIKTGYEKLDKFIGDFYPGEVTVIGSRPAVGKALFLQSIMERTILSSGTPSLFYSIEKPLEMIYGHFVSLMSGIPYSKIRQGGHQKLDENHASLEIVSGQK